MANKKVTEENATAKKTAAKKSAPVNAEAAPARKPAARRTSAKKSAEVVIQSPLGGEITAAEVLAKVGTVDKVYVRVDQNKAYWVRGEETGSVDLW